MSGLPTQNMEWFPDIPYEIFTNHDPYIVIQAHAGREDLMARKIPIAIIERLIDYFRPIQVVLLGTDLNYINIQNCINFFFSIFY